jgi:hypothetical protein
MIDDFDTRACVQPANRDGEGSQELYLYAEAPCDEDTAIIEHLREALRLYESRAARRHIERLVKPEVHDPCPDCGHLLCRHDPGEFA